MVRKAKADSEATPMILVPKGGVEPKDNNIQSAVSFARALEIRSPSEVEVGTEGIRAIGLLEKKVQDTLGEQVESSRATWKLCVSKRDAFLNPLKAAKELIRDKITAFRVEQQRQLEEERQKKQAELDARTAKERARLEKKADRLENKGDVAGAEIIQDIAESLETPEAEVDDEVPDGMTYRDQVSVAVENLPVLLKSIFSGRVKIDLSKLLTVKASPLVQYVKATGVTELPGCRITVKQIPVVR